MTRSDVSAVVLLLVAAGAAFMGVVGYRTIGDLRNQVGYDFLGSWVQAHAMILLALGLFAAACLCTAAVLWARGGRGKAA